MKPPGKTTLDRMQRTALREAERIEIGQDARVRDGLLKEPMPHQVELRDDFMGIVRLIDRIMSDKAVLERLQDRKPGPAPARSPQPAPGDIAAIDEEAPE